MKFLSIIFLSVFYARYVKCEPDKDLFLKIGSFNYGSNLNFNVKEFYLSKNFEETWMDGFNFCLNNGMEMLRIESNEELAAFVRATKYHWLEFGDDLYVDGFKKSDKKWTFFLTGRLLDRYIYTAKKSFDTKAPDECMIFLKNHPDQFGSSNCFETRKKFVCQIVSQKRLGEAESGPLRVDVRSRILEEIGSYSVNTSDTETTTSTYYLNRDYVLSPSSALKFCRNFNMELVEIDSEEKLVSLMRLILRNKNRFREKFLIGGVRSSIIERLSWVNLVNLQDEDLGNCLAVIADGDKGNDSIYYFDCNSPPRPLGFICEKREVDGQHREEPIAKKRSIGVKILGYLRPPTYFNNNMSYYISESVGLSWFDSYSYCKTIGMDLFAPPKNDVTAQVVRLLNDYLNSNIAISVTRIGTDGFWYAAKIGQEFDYKPEKTPAPQNKCLQLKAIGQDKFKLTEINCEAKSERFICESTDL